MVFSTVASLARGVIPVIVVLMCLCIYSLWKKIIFQQLEVLGMCLSLATALLLCCLYLEIQGF